MADAFAKTKNQLTKIRTRCQKHLSADEKEAVYAYLNLGATGKIMAGGKIPHPNGLDMGKSLWDKSLKGTPIPRKHASRIKLVDQAIRVSGEHGACLPLSPPVTLWRGLRHPDMWRGARIGKTIVVPAFQSTTHSLHRALNYGGATLMRYEFDPKRPVKFVYCPFEDEVVLERGVELKLLSKEAMQCEKGRKSSCQHPEIPIGQQMFWTGFRADVFRVLATKPIVGMGF